MFVSVHQSLLWGINPLLGNARNTHAANNKGGVFSVFRAATVAMQRAIQAATNIEDSVFHAVRPEAI
jgi:hypothetical protein